MLRPCDLRTLSMMMDGMDAVDVSDVTVLASVLFKSWKKENEEKEMTHNNDNIILKARTRNNLQSTDIEDEQWRSKIAVDCKWRTRGLG